jgi:hypothetical protein
MASARLRAIRWRCSSVSDGELFTGMEEEVWFGTSVIGTEEEEEEGGSRNSFSLFFSMAFARLRAIRWRCSSVSDGELFTGMEEEVWFGRSVIGTEEAGRKRKRRGVLAILLASSFLWPSHDLDCVRFAGVAHTS